MGSRANRKRTTTTQRSRSQLEAAQLSKLEDELRALLGRSESNAWRCGMIFDQLVRGGASSNRGYASVNAYADARFPQGYRTLRRYRRVALVFGEHTVVLHGAAKLDLGMRYLAAIGKGAKPTALLGTEIPVPTRDRLQRLPFAKASTTQIVAAIRAAQGRPHANEPAEIRRAKKWQELLQAAVAAPSGKHQHAPSVRAHPHPTRIGLVRFDLIGIDSTDLERVARALLAEARKEANAFAPRANAQHAGAN